MENRNNKNKKEENKYILLEKPMFFNSKLNKDENKKLEQTNNYKELDNNISSITTNSKENSIKDDTKQSNGNKTNNSNINDKKESPKKEMKFRCFITDPNETKWCSRYGRPGYVKSSKNEEDEKYLKEHFKNLEKKRRIQF